MDLLDREDLRLAIRTALLKRLEDLPVFDALFESFWGGSVPVPRNPPVVPPDAEEEREGRVAASRRKRSVESWQELEELAVPAPSSREALGRQDYATGFWIVWALLVVFQLLAGFLSSESAIAVFIRGVAMWPALILALLIKLALPDTQHLSCVYCGGGPMIPSDTPRGAAILAEREKAKH